MDADLADSELGKPGIHQKSFGAFVKFKIMQDRILTLNRRNCNFNGIVVAQLAESMWYQMRGGSCKTEMQR